MEINWCKILGHRVHYEERWNVSAHIMHHIHTCKRKSCKKELKNYKIFYD